MPAKRVLSCGNLISYAGLKIIENKASQARLVGQDGPMTTTLLSSADKLRAYSR